MGVTEREKNEGGKHAGLVMLKQEGVYGCS